MMERRQLVEFWRGDRAGLLVTLVGVEGSSYRQRGARLVTGAAGYAGTISGGCLESDVVKKAQWLTRAGAAVERYSMRFDDTAEIPFGLGCGGTVDLLFEPLETAEGRALMEAMERSLGGVESVVVTFLPGGGRGLRRLVLDAAGEVVFASEALSAEKITCAAKLDPAGVYEGRFAERLRAPQRLLVLGAGDDARPLVRMAAGMGWSVEVADGRSQLVRAERFPEALVRGVAETPEVRAADAVVVMTHSYEQDREMLVRVLPEEPKYLGLLGSRHRSSLLVSEAAAMLGRPVAWCCDRVFAPIGMDLGGDGPEAIALAIVAEVQGVMHGRGTASRRLTAAEVERQLELGGVSQYLRVQCGLGA